MNDEHIDDWCMFKVQANVHAHVRLQLKAQQNTCPGLQQRHFAFLFSKIRKVREQ